MTWQPPCATPPRTAEQERPNSQPAIVWLSDGIAPIFYEDRDATQQILIRSNATFSSLTTDLTNPVQISDADRQTTGRLAGRESLWQR